MLCFWHMGYRRILCFFFIGSVTCIVYIFLGRVYFIKPSSLFVLSCHSLFFSLCQEGAGHQVMSAFVEIVFDNSDNRIPVHELSILVHLVVFHFLMALFCWLCG